MEDALRILIADDQYEIREALTLALRGEGFEITSAASPDEIVDMVAARELDLVLMDLNYTRGIASGEEGLDVLSRLADIERKPPVVIMTAWGTIDLAVEAMRRGATDFVLKPWDNDALVSKLRSLAGWRADAGRAAGDLEDARRVQSRLCPRTLPRMSSIVCAGSCIEAGPVGGDSYDFFDLGPGRMALALADASGKGVSAALVAAHLQAALRASVRGGARFELATIVRSVNELLFECTAPERYATLFLATYDDHSRVLRYVNCGHAPPILLRGDGALLRLDSTATALGLFEEWSCREGELRLEPEDVLAVFSDGVTEATDAKGEDFGSERVVAALRAHAGCEIASLPERILREVRRFSGVARQDDLALVVVRGVRVGPQSVRSA